jgi:hypothetical protein
MGVTLFRETAPDNFDNFFRALSTMFRLTAGETWVDGLAATDEQGNPYYGTAIFIYSYIVIVVWILLQVSVAVLLVTEILHVNPCSPITRMGGTRGRNRTNS